MLSMVGIQNEQLAIQEKRFEFQLTKYNQNMIIFFFNFLLFKNRIIFKTDSFLFKTIWSNSVSSKQKISPTKKYSDSSQVNNFI